ncbi:MAG: hypothetical protein ACSHXY_02780 [Alphaproteobacteria bacterium]
MSIQKTMIPAITAGLLLCGACSQNTGASSADLSANAQSEKQAKAYVSHVTKAGAAVGFSHNYDGHTKVGETENIAITLNDRYTSGILTASATQSDGLSVQSADQTFRMEGNDAHIFDVQVSAASGGVYSLNFQIVADADVGNVARTTATIMIYVGDTAHFEKNRKVDTKPNTSKAAPGLVIMDAEETITVDN